MGQRTIKTYSGYDRTRLRKLLQSLFALELLRPSRTLFLYSPWISNIDLIDNRMGQFNGLFRLPEPIIYTLTDVLQTLAHKGGEVRLIVRPNFVRTETVLRHLIHPRITVKRVETFHEKSITSDHFWFRGSMNITYFGTERNDEHIEVTNDGDAVAQALLDAHQRWGRL